VSAAPRSLAQFSRDLRRLPTVVAQKVAAAAAPAITALAKETFDAGETPYGVTWAPKEDGSRATLRGDGKDGHLADHLYYVAIGTKLRVKLGVEHAKYVIGKRPVFPTQGGVLPVEYVRTLQRTAVDVCRAELGR
jgi:hypothetical protein